MEGENRLLVIDGSNIFFRSYFGLINSDFTRPTWGIHGTINSIASFAKRFKPTHMVVVFDKGRSAYRLELYPEYKANRPKSTEFDSSDSADEQLETTQRILRLFGIRVWQESNIEGDDVIGAVVQRFASSKTNVTIISGDKDLRQLIAPGVVVYHPSLKAKDHEPWTVDSIIDEYGITPDRLPEIWALSGDKGDNIPGIPYIGDKRALALIKKHGDIYKVGLSEESRLEGFRHQVYINLKLVQLHPELSNFQLELDDVRFVPVPSNDPESHELLSVLQENDLNRIITAWTGSSLWAERGKRLRDLHK